LRLYIEGKRTEELSRGIAWYPKRNQLVRNLESAKHHAGEVPFLQVLIAERSLTCDLRSAAAEGLPHLSSGERDALILHYGGISNWALVCSATGLDAREMPDSVADARKAKAMRGDTYIRDSHGD
jgi:hypothetical protein